MHGLTWRNSLWLTAYLAMIVAVIIVMLQARAKLIPLLSSPESQAEWDQWRRRAVEPGPVKRRPVKSPEPNLLVLLRDHFASFLGFVLVFLSLIFFVTMFFVRGALASPHLPREPTPDEKNGEKNG